MGSVYVIRSMCLSAVDEFVYTTHCVQKYDQFSLASFNSHNIHIRCNGTVTIKFAAKFMHQPCIIFTFN